MRIITFVWPALISTIVGCSINLGGNSPAPQQQKAVPTVGLMITPSPAYVQALNTLQLSGSGGKGPYSFVILAGSGSITTAGVYTAGPTAAEVTVRMADANGASVTDVVNVAAPTPPPPTAPTYHWVQGGFGVCSATCPGGTQVQAITCEDNTGTLVSNSLCPGTPPPNSQACNVHACTCTMASTGSYYIGAILSSPFSGFMSLDQCQTACGSQGPGFCDWFPNSLLPYNCYFAPLSAGTPATTGGAFGGYMGTCQ